MIPLLIVLGTAGYLLFTKPGLEIERQSAILLVALAAWIASNFK